MNAENSALNLNNRFYVSSDLSCAPLATDNYSIVFSNGS